MLPTIDVATASAMVRDGTALLVDLRTPAEHARVHIPGSRLAPLDHVEAADLPASAAAVFVCWDGTRTERAGDRLAAAAPGVAYVLDGGLTAWVAAGLPVVERHSRKIDSERQGQILLGLIGLGGVALGAFHAEVWFALSAAAAVALVALGLTGSRILARWLDRMPWNGEGN